jgi:hypothetical protein
LSTCAGACGIPIASSAIRVDGHDHRILVSQDLTGHEIVAALVVHYAGRHIQGPQPAFQPPAAPYVEWHGKNVFRGPPRSSEPAP